MCTDGFAASRTYRPGQGEGPYLTPAHNVAGFARTPGPGQPEEGAHRGRIARPARPSSSISAYSAGQHKWMEMLSRSAVDHLTRPCDPDR